MKSEKEKMLGGEIYDCGDDALQRRWHEAKRLQAEYNATASDDAERQAALLDRLLGSRGEDVSIAAPFFVDYGENIYLGRNVEINMNCVFLDCNRITIGDYSGIGPGVHIYRIPSDRSRRAPLARRPFLEVAYGARDHRPQRMDRRRYYRPARCNHR